MQPKKKSQTLSTYNYPSNTSKSLSALLSNMVKPKGQKNSLDHRKAAKIVNQC